MQLIASLTALLAAAGSASAFIEVMADFSSGAVVATGYTEKNGLGLTSTFNLQSGRCTAVPVTLIGAFGSFSKPTGTNCTIFQKADCTGASRFLREDKGMATDLAGSDVGTNGRGILCNVDTVPIFPPDVSRPAPEVALVGTTITMIGFSKAFGSGDFQVFSAQPDECVALPANLNNNLESLTKPRQGVSCELFVGDNCTGTSHVLGANKGQAANLRSTSVGDRTSSIRCSIA